MRIEVVSADQRVDYIRYARAETIKAVGGAVTAEAIEPIPAARYVLAYGEDGSQPIGMAESAMHAAIYESYAESPYASVCDLDTVCPISQMAGIRTIFVEPEHRAKSPLFFILAAASAMVFRGYGATHSTATTNAADSYLNNLYKRVGGQLMGTSQINGFDAPSSFFLFDLEQLLEHRAMRRCMRSIEFVANDFSGGLAPSMHLAV